MDIAILGTGIVGRTIAAGLAELDHAVVIGTRDAARTLARTEPDAMGNPPFRVWHAEHPEVNLGTLAEAAAHGELVFNCTNGMGSLSALEMAGEENLSGKVLVDIANPLDYSEGMPPTLFVCNDDSLAERIQRTFPSARVVKTLNTMNAFLMVNPGQLADGDHDVLLCGNDAAAKGQVTDLLKDGFGWKRVIDLGDITAARGMEMYLPLWLRLMGALETPMFNVRFVR